MEFCPALGIGWLNGWIPLAGMCFAEGLLLLLSPKDVVTKLFDRSGWDKKQKAFLLIGKLFSLACLVLLVLTPLKPGRTSPCHTRFQDHTSWSAGDQRTLQSVTPSTNTGAIRHIRGDVFGDRFVACPPRAHRVEAVSASHDRGGGRSLLGTLRRFLQGLYAARAPVFPEGACQTSD